MKAIHFIALLLFALLISGCAENEVEVETEPKTRDSYPPDYRPPNIGFNVFYNFGALSISIVDAEGNDLLKEHLSKWDYIGGNEVPRSFYTLELIYPDPAMCRHVMHNRYPLPPPNVFRRSVPRLDGFSVGNYSHSFLSSLILNNIGGHSVYFAGVNFYPCRPIPPAEWITIRLTIPRISDKAFEFTTYWRMCECSSCNRYRYSMHKTLMPFYCYRIEFEGREYISERLITYFGYVSNTIRFTIVLGDD